VKVGDSLHVAARGSAVPLLGAHCSIAGGVHNAVIEAATNGCDVVQLFTGNTRSWAGLTLQPVAQSGKFLTKNKSQWRAKEISEAEARQFATELASRKIAHPISHASYLINLASPVPELREKSIAAMVIELQRADQLGIPFVIVHPGARMAASEEDGIALVAESINEIHQRTKKTRARVTLELTAGQGSCLGHSLKHLADMIALVKRADDVAICVDTCHAFAAGVDLRDRKTYLAFWREFDELLGLDRLKALHLNDSKREFGSRVDRHEHIGQGHLGAIAFRHILKDKNLRQVPMYLETKKGTHNGETWDMINLRTLREIAKS
jgi:deoxyribonuclease-4